MGTVLTYDIGCEPTPIQAQIDHPSERTGREDGFVSGRRYARPTENLRYRYVDEPPQTWTAVKLHWSLTYGGALLMDFIPPDGGPARVVRFARAPKLEKRGAQMVTFSVELEDAPPF